MGNATALQAACRRRPPLGLWTLLEEVIPKAVLKDLVPSGDDGLFAGAGREGKSSFGRDARPKLDFSTCAVVGNSGVLLMNEYGEAIDAHTFILRMNVAPTGGPVRKHTGGTTHARVLNNRW